MPATILRVEHTRRHGENIVVAYFRSDRGGEGSVTVAQAIYDMHGIDVLSREADILAGMAMDQPASPPDRHEELR